MNIIHKDIVDSTNSEVLRLADNGEALPLWVYADKQTDGRGRRGNNWQSLSGNLFTSGVYEFQIAPNYAATLSFVVSLALFKALNKYINIDYIKLKWPNDILVNAKKLSGILLESYFVGNKLRLVIGIGVNILNSPKIEEYETIAINDCLMTGAEIPSPRILLDEFLNHFDFYFEEWRQGKLVAILQEWKKFAYNLNKNIRVKYGNEILEGIFSNINESGELVLILNSGEYISINAGEVFTKV